MCFFFFALFLNKRIFNVDIYEIICKIWSFAKTNGTMNCTLYIELIYSQNNFQKMNFLKMLDVIVNTKLLS